MVSGATRGSPRSARDTVDWLILSLRAMSLLVTAIAGAWQTSPTNAPGRARAAGRVDRFDKTTGCGLCIRSHTTKESPFADPENPHAQA